MDYLEPVFLARLQFALTALYHFIFVPLTLGLAWLIFILESIYVITDEPIWKEATKFWGKLFGINFAMGVATGITMEFQFGTNWAYYSHYVGDIFGAPLAIEGLMAFFLESTMIGLFFFGWDKMSKKTHLLCTFLLALATNLSAVWILIANAWMQNPVGSFFNHETMRMEMSNFYELIFNPVAQAKFIHTVTAGYVCGAVFMLAISSYFLYKEKKIEIMKRSFSIASIFGLGGTLGVIFFGDESGYHVSESQTMKMAAVEAMWETYPAPAPFTLFAIPNVEKMENKFEIKIPYLLGLLGTRSLDKEIPGIKQLIQQGEKKIIDGIEAYKAVLILKKEPQNQKALEILKQYEKYLGYALLLKAQNVDPLLAKKEDIQKTALKLIPQIHLLFWSFRIMVFCGLCFLVLFFMATYKTLKKQFQPSRFHRFALYALPLPWIAVELGWIVAESGRQPWAIQGILPTALGVSAVSTSMVFTSLMGFVIFYSFLLIIDIILMVKYVRQELYS